MGLDSPHHLTSDAQATPASASTVSGRKATTASMQNLLARYFETQSADAAQGEPRPFTPATPAAFETIQGHAPSSTAPAPSTEAAVAASFARLEAAFVALPTAPVPEEAPPAPIAAAPVLVAPTPAPEPPAVEPHQDGWPEAARLLVASLLSEREDMREQLHRLNMQLAAAQDQADNDVLTPTLNRRAFLREVHRAMADCKRYGEEACLIYLDLDSFKQINDTYGHGAGDTALVYVAETLKASVREGDAVGRIGGDEFAVLLRHADLASTRIKAMKLEAELMMGTFEYNGLHLKTGGSFGVRSYGGQATAESWLSEADAAMFLVKKSSR